MKPPMPYFGSKATLADRIVDLLPAHRHYVEPFAGSLAVLLAKSRAPYETVNDLDGSLVTFWRVLRDQPLALARACALTPHSRAEQGAASDQPDGMDELEIARRVWVQLTQGRNATRRPSGTGWRYDVSTAASKSIPSYLAGYVDRLLPAAERLHGVTLESRPAADIIDRYGADASTLIYADPPYVASTRVWGNNYAVEMRTDEEHRDLASALRCCRATVVLSGYASPLYDDIYAEWHRVELRAHTGQSTDGARVEVLWSNQPIADLHLFSEATG